MILITGATGQLGRLVIAHLLKTLPANRIVAAVRNPAKAQDLEALGIQVRLGDYDHPEHWPAALQGVEKVLLISASDVGIRAAKHKVVIDAVKASGTVAFIAYTSMLRADTCRIPFASEDRETEQMIAASGKRFVFLRHGWYTENYVMNADDAVKSGEFHGAAAVEAARAGEHGRGFAVVAAEVRTLAQRSAAAAKEIKTLIADSSEKVEHGVRCVNDTGRTMKDILSQVSRVSQLISEINASTAEQNAGLGEVSQSVNQIDQATQQNAALVEESAAAAESLKAQAQRLTQVVHTFRLDV